MDVRYGTNGPLAMSAPLTAFKGNGGPDMLTMLSAVGGAADTSQRLPTTAIYEYVF
jgi:hypothetical protein